jgi:hypothetical protein
MMRAVEELRRVADHVVVTIRHGAPGCRVNYTHRLADFYSAIVGLHIAERRITEQTRDGTEEIFLLRAPKWSDVVEQFAWHGPPAEIEMQRLADEWRTMAGLCPLPMAHNVTAENFEVRADYWTTKQCGYALRSMRRAAASYITDEPPRFDPHRPATVLNFEGVDIVLDGRRRMNLWLKEEGRRFPVLWLWRRPC